MKKSMRKSMKSKKSARFVKSAKTPKMRSFTLYFKRGTHFDFGHPDHKNHDATLYTATLSAKNEVDLRKKFTKANPLTKIVMVRENGVPVVGVFKLRSKEDVWVVKNRPSSHWSR